MSTNPVQLDFSKAVPLSNQPAQPQSDSGAGVTLDFSKAQPVGANAPTPSSSPQPKPGGDDQWGPQWASDASEAVKNAVVGAGKGVLSTVSGTDEWARQHLPALLTENPLTGKPADLQHVHEMATPHGTAQNVGNGIEDLAEFFLGDEALKGLSLSDRLLKASKTARAIEESPLLNRAFQAGVRALRGGTVGAVQGGAKTGDLSQAAGAGVAGALGNAVVPEAFDAAKAAPQAVSDAVQTLRNVIQPGAIQDAFQGQIRGIINDAAKEYGVNPSSATSIRDVAQDVSNQLQGRAKAAYQALDEASGGRVQRFSDAIKAVQRKLSNLNGIQTPDDEGAWIQKLNDLQDAHDKAMQEAEDAGVPSQLLNQANADFRKSKAMLDLSKQIRATSEGLRPELAPGANKPMPEKVNTGGLFKRVNKLYDSGRLQDALGKSRSDDLLRAINDSHVASQTAQSWAKLAKTGAKYAAYGALPFGGYEIVRHLLGE